MKRRGEKEKWKVVKRRSLSMHKCLIQLHHRRAPSAGVRCDYTFAAAIIAKPRRWERLTPKDLSIFLMDLLSLPSRPRPHPAVAFRRAQDIRSLNFKTKTILMLTWHIFNRCQSKFSCEKRVPDWNEVYYGCRRFYPCCRCRFTSFRMCWIESFRVEVIQFRWQIVSSTMKLGLARYLDFTISFPSNRPRMVVILTFY